MAGLRPVENVDEQSGDNLLPHRYGFSLFYDWFCRRFKFAPPQVQFQQVGVGGAAAPRCPQEFPALDATSAAAKKLEKRLVLLFLLNRFEVAKGCAGLGGAASTAAAETDAIVRVVPRRQHQ